MTHTWPGTGGPPARLRRRWLRNRPIRVKLAVILLLPVLAILGLTGLTVVSAAGRAAAAGQAHELVALGGTVARLTALLQAERAAAVLVFAEGASAVAVDEYRRSGAATDAMAAQLRDSVAGVRLPAGLRPVLDRVGDHLAGLVRVRERVVSAPDAVLSAVAFRYRAAIADLISYRQALGQVGVAANTANGLRAAAALSAAIESVGQLQVATVRAMAAGALTPAAQQEAVAANAAITEAMGAFVDLGPSQWPALLNSRVSGEEVLQAERLQSEVVRSQPGAVPALGTDARGWSAAVGERMRLMHVVESDVDAQLLAAVADERDAQVTSIVTTLAVVAGLLVVVIAVGWVAASSLSGSLSRLQAGAIEVASRRLPTMVRQLDAESADPATVRRLMDAAAEPIPADGTDEIGRVGEAFNEVAASAVRLAGEQAALRASVGAILLALSRRLQLRADAMMGSLDTLERREANPERLGKLFELDHIATLIRRLIFNLQVLAGGRTGRGRPDPVPLDSVLRAAGQEIDHYQRVVTTAVDGAVRIRGASVDELVHLLAELLDNATRFSPPDTPVLVEARRVGDQLHIQIRDHGSGMTASDLHLAQDRIANPHRLDHRTTQHMGLPVAGALAQRLGVKIEFRSAARRGTWVDLTVPADLLEQDRSAIHQPAVAMEPADRMAGAPAARVPRRPQATAVIYESMARDPSRRPSLTAEAWDESVRAAAVAASTPVTQWSPSGLPVREPGGRVFPPVPPFVGQPPARRDPDRIRRQMAAYQIGLGQAGRRRAANG